MKKNWIPILITVVALVLRLYRIDATMTFLEDEGRDMLIVKRMVDTGRPGLLGPQTSTGNMYLGPFYYYFISPALILSNFDPVGPSILIALTGALTAGLMYLIVSSWFGKRSGAVASVLYAVMPLPVAFTRNSWNPNLVPLISLLMLWVLDKLYPLKRPKTVHWLAFGALIGILVQLHYMALMFLPFLLSVLIYRYRKNLKTLLKGSLYVTLGVVVLLSPFLLFELRNNFVNTQALIKFVKADEIHHIRYELPIWLWFNNAWRATSNIIAGLMGRSALSIEPYRNLITSLFIALSGLSLFSLKRRANRGRIFTLLLLLFAPLAALGIYQENIHLHYLGFLFPLVYIVPSIFISQTKRVTRYISIFAVGLSVLYTVPTTYGYLNSGPTNQAEKSEAVANYIAEKSEGRDYNAVVFQDSASDATFQYFLSLTENPPSNELEETLFLICVDRECEEEDVQFDWLLKKGPPHPSLMNYLGHPFMLTFPNEREMVGMEHVSQGVWVGELRVSN